MFRRFDHLGRIVIPMEIRRALGATAPGTWMRISLEGDRVVLKKEGESCKVCGKDKNLISNLADNAWLCRECLDEFTKNGRPVNKAE